MSEFKHIPIVVPSHLRPDKVLTPRACTNTIICVPAKQEAAYREHNPELEIVAHPDDVVGLPPKRQWIFDHWGSVFFMDDDVEACIDLTHAGSKLPVVDPATTYNVIQRAWDQSIQMGVFLFTFRNLPRPASYNPLRPFLLTGRVAGHSFGMRAGSRLWFRTDMTAVDDFWISGLNAHYHRMMLLDTRYSFRSMGCFTAPGGTAAHRTIATEKSDTAVLRRAFGPDVIRDKKKAPLRKSLMHAYERTMRIPF